VHIKSGRFEDAPAIAPNYLSTAEDRQVAADSLRVTRKIVSQSALAKYQPEEFKPGVQFQTDEELTRLAGDIATTIFHPVGTTKMGRTTTRWRWSIRTSGCAAYAACAWSMPA
jgi:choline dehydrogenase